MTSTASIINSLFKEAVKTKSFVAESRLTVPNDEPKSAAQKAGSFRVADGKTIPAISRLEKKESKSYPKLKDLESLTLDDLDLNRNLTKKTSKISDLKEKIDQIEVLPQGNKDLKNLLRNKEKVRNLVKDMTTWLSRNSSKANEMLETFRKHGENNCLTYKQFIGTMINLDAPFRIMDLCALVVKLSRQKAGLIGEEDIKMILPRERKEPSCKICGFGVSKLAQAVKGPFGILQIALNIPSKKPVSQSEEAAATTNRLVQLFADSVVKKSKALGVASNTAEKTNRFKAVLNNLNKHKLEQSETKDPERLKELRQKERNDSRQAAQMLSSLAKAIRSQNISFETEKYTAESSKSTKNIAVVAAAVTDARAATGATESTGAGASAPVTRKLSKKSTVHIEKKKSQRSLLRKKSSHRLGSYKIENINPMNLIKRRMLENRRAVSSGKLSITRTFTRSASQMNNAPKAEVKTIKFSDILPTVKNERKTSRLRDTTKTGFRAPHLKDTPSPTKSESKSDPNPESKVTRFKNVISSVKSEPHHARFQDIVVKAETEPKTSAKPKTTSKTGKFQDIVKTVKVEPKANRLKNMIMAAKKEDTERSRLFDITSKLDDEIKTINSPQLTNIVTTTTMRMKAKRKFSLPKNQINFLKIPKVIDDAVPAFSYQTPVSQELFVLIQMRSIMYESIATCPAHFSLLLSNKTTIHSIAEEIKKVNDITTAEIFISPYKQNFRQSLLHHDCTLKECGYRGYCKGHPQKISLFYDFEIIYNISTTTTTTGTTNTATTTTNINNNNHNNYNINDNKKK